MLTIGIVNNMSPAAIQGTERRFCELLTAAADGRPFRILWFRLVGARPANYAPADHLQRYDLDGMIITGVEPKAAILPDEPFWDPLVRTIDWASRRATSVIFSCLAAHAAVLHLDAVERQPRSRKIFGLFRSVKTNEHPLVADTPQSWLVPHSRWNDLPRPDLEARGYTVLADSRGAGVDMFVKQVRRSLFVFMQSHPEYQDDVLMREYRRDIERFHLGARLHYPTAPIGYFDTETLEKLESLRATPAEKGRGRQILEQAALPLNTWNDVAVQIYRNWLSMLAARGERSYPLLAAQ